MKRAEIAFLTLEEMNQKEQEIEVARIVTAAGFDPRLPFSWVRDTFRGKVIFLQEENA